MFKNHKPYLACLVLLCRSGVGTAKYQYIPFCMLNEWGLLPLWFVRWHLHHISLVLQLPSSDHSILLDVSYTTHPTMGKGNLVPCFFYQLLHAISPFFLSLHHSFPTLEFSLLCHGPVEMLSGVMLILFCQHNGHCIYRSSSVC